MRAFGIDQVGWLMGLEPKRPGNSGRPEGTVLL
jgi:hypothetical protein